MDIELKVIESGYYDTLNASINDTTLSYIIKSRISNIFFTLQRAEYKAKGKPSYKNLYNNKDIFFESREDVMNAIKNDIEKTQKRLEKKK